MAPERLDATFDGFAGERGVSLRSATVADGFAMMLRFYREHRIEGLADHDGDMLLFQWGTYDWGRGEHFELDLTRQVILADEEGDDAIFQLHFAYQFEPTSALRALGDGNRWCESTGALPTFAEFVTTHPAYVAVAAARPVTLDMYFEGV